MLFTDLQLDHRLQKTLALQQFSELTEVQQSAIPKAMQGKDIVVGAKTGSGKTLAFLVPAIQRLLRQKALSKQDPRALILAPTRELAKQVFVVAKKLTQGTNLSSVLIVGGENFNDQAKLLRKNPDILVATAGRLADHLDAKHMFLSGLELLVLDEADRMLTLGFKDQLTLIQKQADHRKRQTMMFSATVDNADVQHLISIYMKSPERVEIDKVETPHEDIKLDYYLCDHVEHKDALLANLVNIEEREQAMIFAATREDTVRLTELLTKAGKSAMHLHGEMLQNQRNQVIQDFALNKHQILVTTDVASRGLDNKNVALVINYDLPKQADEFVHRVGRTGRAGDSGRAISLIGKRDWYSFVAIKQRLKIDPDFSTLLGFEAKFKGFATKGINKKTKPQQSGNKKVSNTSSDKVIKKTKPNKPIKRQKQEDGEELGFIPIKRKK